MFFLLLGRDGSVNTVFLSRYSRYYTMVMDRLVPTVLKRPQLTSAIAALAAAAVLFLAFLSVLLLLVDASLVIADARVELVRFDSEWHRFRYEVALLKVRHIRGVSIFEDTPTHDGIHAPMDELRSSFSQQHNHLVSDSKLASFRVTFPEVNHHLEQLEEAWLTLDSRLAAPELPVHSTTYDLVTQELEHLRLWLGEYSAGHYRAFRILLTLLLFVLLVGAAAVILSLRELERSRAERQRSRLLTQHVIQAQEEERERIALDLHDDVAQLLSAAIVELELEPLSNPKALGLLRTATRDLREISYGLGVTELRELGLVDAVNALARDFTKSTGVPVNLRTYGLDSLKLEFESSKNLYRILQECLTNTKRHASARNVEIVLTLSYPRLLIKYTDDGVGMDLSGETLDGARTRRIGLRGIRERASFLNAHIEFRSAPREGFSLLLRLHVTALSAPDSKQADLTTFGMPAFSRFTNGQVQ